ncbi:hypothetical protein HMPREF1556_00122 [Porphyromonas sp. oral taxon 278 str. W7784]|nr:hypothetical protein HMPREF1556_00122 [Porphyromonas sp. oral taxon 278 str. W7784]
MQKERGGTTCQLPHPRLKSQGADTGTSPPSTDLFGAHDLLSGSRSRPIFEGSTGRWSGRGLAKIRK